MQNKKVILFLELNFLTIIPCVICKVFNYSTFYLASSKYFRNESIFRILEFVNILKLNYEYFDNEVEYKLIKNLCGNAHDLYFKYYKDNVFEKLINEYFNFNSDNKKIFELAIDDYLIKKLNGKYGLGTGIVGLYIFAEYFSKKNSNVYVFVSRNIYTKDIINKYKKYINMYPWWLNTILNTIKSIYNLLYFSIYKLLYFVKYLYEKIFINKFVKTEKKKSIIMI